VDLVLTVKKEEDLKEKNTDEICPYCLSVNSQVFIHGHYQCSKCHVISVPCCNGETENTKRLISLRGGM
tara:strand:+ start:1116 stop:1322 length:207 start_codon:yes stop_codon:yes gene_type:complete